MVRLLLHNALRVDEACAADVTDLGEDSGHRVLRVIRKCARKAKIPLTPATVAALEAYLAARAQQAGAGEWRQLTSNVAPIVVGDPHATRSVTVQESIDSQHDQLGVDQTRVVLDLLEGLKRVTSSNAQVRWPDGRP